VAISVASARGARPGAFYFNEAVVNGDLGAGWDIGHRDIDSVVLQSEVRAKIGGHAVIDKPGVIATQDIPMQPSVDVPIVQQALPNNRGLLLETLRIEIQIESQR
jgi:hypothetical protein